MLTSTNAQICTQGISLGPAECDPSSYLVFKSEEEKLTDPRNTKMSLQSKPMNRKRAKKRSPTTPIVKNTMAKLEITNASAVLVLGGMVEAVIAEHA